MENINSITQYTCPWYNQQAALSSSYFWVCFSPEFLLSKISQFCCWCCCPIDQHVLHFSWCHLLRSNCFLPLTFSCAVLPLWCAWPDPQCTRLYFSFVTMDLRIFILAICNEHIPVGHNENKRDTFLQILTALLFILPNSPLMNY